MDILATVGEVAIGILSVAIIVYGFLRLFNFFK